MTAILSRLTVLIILIWHILVTMGRILPVAETIRGYVYGLWQYKISGKLFDFCHFMINIALRYMLLMESIICLWSHFILDASIYLDFPTYIDKSFLSLFEIVTTGYIHTMASLPIMPSSKIGWSDTHPWCTSVWNIIWRPWNVILKH